MSKHYVTSEEKYKDNKETAICFLLVGIVGLIVLVFVYFKFFSDSPSFSTYFRLAVFLLLFIGMIIGGIVSLSASKKYRASIYNDKSEKQEIENYLLNTEKLSEYVDSKIEEDNLSDEELYISRNDILLDILKEQFENSDETLLEEIIENKYDELFE